MRLDVFLVEQKLAVSRTQAQELIAGGYISLHKNNISIVLDKASYQVKVEDTDLITVEKNELQKYVSRGGLKLESALKQAGIDIKGKVVLDIGQSTGGFSDCLLQSGARMVVGIDVGHDQLHDKLKAHPQIKSIEGLHVKDLKTHAGFLALQPAGYDLIVADVSFISLTKVMSDIKSYLKTEGDYLFLVKPQFELDAQSLDNNGIVKNPKSYIKVQTQVEQEALNCFGSVINYFKSEKLGKDGNQEFFIYGKKSV